MTCEPGALSLDDFMAIHLLHAILHKQYTGQCGTNVWGFPTLRVSFWGPYKYNSFGSTLGSPYLDFGKLQHLENMPTRFKTLQPYTFSRRQEAEIEMVEMRGST